jgi:cytidylate kinase
MPNKMPNYELERPSDLGKLVTVGGPGATGSSTIAKILSKKWGLHRVDAGEIMRNNLNQYELDEDNDELEEYLENQVATHPEIDKKIDRFLVRMSYYPDMLIEGKFFAAIATSVGIPCTIKIWITAKLHTRVMRVIEREGFLDKEPDIDKNHSVYKKIRTELMQRQSNDMRRCQKLYHQDLSKPEDFNDIVLDTTSLDIPRTMKKLFKMIEQDDKLNSDFPPKYLKY